MIQFSADHRAGVTDDRCIICCVGDVWCYGLYYTLYMDNVIVFLFTGKCKQCCVDRTASQEWFHILCCIMAIAFVCTLHVCLLLLNAF